LCTDLDLSLLYILILGTYNKFARENNFRVPGVCFPQPCSSADRRFAGSRSRLQNYWRMVLIPRQKNRWNTLYWESALVREIPDPNLTISHFQRSFHAQIFLDLKVLCTFILQKSFAHSYFCDLAISGYEHRKGVYQKSCQWFLIWFVGKGVLKGKMAMFRGSFRHVAQQLAQLFLQTSLKTLLRDESHTSYAVSAFEVFYLKSVNLSWQSWVRAPLARSWRNPETVHLFPNFGLTKQSNTHK